MSYKVDFPDFGNVRMFADSFNVVSKTLYSVRCPSITWVQ